MIYLVMALTLLAGVLAFLLWRKKVPEVTPPDLSKAWERLHEVDRKEAQNADPDAYFRSGLDHLR